MNDLSTSPLYSARPRVALDGEPDVRLGMAVLSLTVQQRKEGLYHCEVVFGNWGAAGDQSDYLYFDRDVLEFGRRLSISMGDGDAGGQIFSGNITALEGRFPQQRPPEILVLAEDRLQDFRMTRRTRTFEDVSLEDVIEQIAGDYELSTDTDISSPQYAVLAQLNQSDLAFLREQARLLDAEIWLADNTLHVVQRANLRGQALSMTYRERLHEFSVLADLAHQRTSLVVSGWDVQAKEAVEYEADDAAIQNELNGDACGGSILQQEFGDRSEHLVHLNPADQQQAQSYAEAHYRTMARRFVSGNGIAEGDARLTVGARLSLQGLGGLFNGDYYVSEVTHTFDLMHGFRTRFHVDRAGLGAT